MYINPKSISDRKNRFKVRADAFINYVTSTNNCRSMMISSYFGEENLSSCGTCDYCRNKKKELANEEEENKIRKFIIDLLENTRLLQIEIYNQSPDNYKQKLAGIIQNMLEKEQLMIDTDEKLSLNKEAQ
jgi:ATP-dependent DNA helicase RecQ